MDTGTWQATVRRVIKSRTRLKRVGTHTGEHRFTFANCHFIDSRAMMKEEDERRQSLMRELFFKLIN